MKQLTVFAQDLYDLREATGFVSGTDLHDAFTELVGEPSPKGKTLVTIPNEHWLRSAAATANSGRQLAAQTVAYLGSDGAQEFEDKVGFSPEMMKLALKNVQ